MRFLARSLVGLFMLSLTLALLGLAAGSLYSAFQTRMAEGEGAPVARERVFAVRLVDFTPETVTPVLETFGEVRARRTMELRAPLAGRVVELAAGFEDGADVAQGQLLLRMDPADTTAARDLAQSDLDRTVLELREAERAVGLFAEDLAAAEAQAALRASALDRQRDLAGRGVGTDAAIETAELALSSARQSIVSRKQAQAQAEARRAQAGVALDRSRIQLAEAERRLAQTELRAEFAGTLADVSVVVGGILGNNERLGRIIDPEALEVAFRVSTAQFTRLVDEDGALIATPIEVALDVMGTEIYSAGRMTRVSASVGEAATGRLIYISLDAPRGFRPGDFVALRVPEPPLDGLARLPATALDAAGSVLILGPDDRLVAENVDLVRRQGEDVLVRAPQLAGARVVAERGQNLGAGILVRPLGDEAAATPPAAADGQRNGETEGTSTEGAAMVALTPERRAELIAFVKADAAMPDAARARVIAQLSAEAVPAPVVARIEARMGAETIAHPDDEQTHTSARAVRAGAMFRYFTRHGTAANLLLALMVVAGLVALPNMRAQFFPDVVTQTVSVTVSWPGAGAEDVDRGIIEVLDPALLQINGVESTNARAAEGTARITITLDPGADMTRATEDIDTALREARALPAEAEDPQIRRSAWSDRVTDVVVTGPVGVDQLARFADEYVARLFAEGVTRTSIQGVAAPEILVEVTSAALIRNDIGMADIAQAIATGTSARAAGDVGGGTARVRTGTERRSADEIAAIVLRSAPGGATLTIGDVADISVGSVDRARAYFVDENPAITVRVDRTADGDAIGIQQTAQRVADNLALGLPAGVSIDLIRTRAEIISGRLDILVRNGAVGLLMVVGLLFLFLNARTAFWVAAGIPVAMLAAIAAMYAMGLTFNMISLFALIITLGIVVDDAIVVGEHADWRARELGEAPAEAAERAASRMALPVFAASITTVIAFLALVAIGGRFGGLIIDIPLTVTAVLVASLIECFVILPNHMRHALASAAKERWYDWPSRVVNRGFRWVRERAFRPLMRLVIAARYPVLAFAVVLLATQAAQFIRGDVQWRFFSAPEDGAINGNFAMLPGATRDDTLAMMRELQRATEGVAATFEAEHGANPLVFVLAEVGGNAGRGLSGVEGKDPALLGAISIDLIEIDDRPYSSFEFIARLQDAVVLHPQLETLAFRSQRGGPGGDSLSVRIAGGESAVLKAAAEALKTALVPFPEVSALEDTLAYDKEELSLTLTAQGQALGFSIDALGRTLRDRLNGIEAASFADGLRTARVRVTLNEGELTADFLDRTLMRSPGGLYVPLADIVRVESRTGFSTIARENGVRVVTVTGDLSEDDPARAAEITDLLRTTILPDIEERFAVTTELSGLAEQEREFLSDALFGFGLCLLGIYLTLAWVFASWARPLLVLAVIPFGLVGAIWGHAQWDVAFSLFSVVGLVGMTGIIINDAIVLVTTVDEHARNRGLVPAIVDASCDRLRPVLLTTLTTVLGLAPLLFERSSQAEFLKPTVITLVYGLGFGMVLVLMVVPALLAVQFDLQRMGSALRRAMGPRKRGRGLGALVGAAALTIGGLFAATLGPWLILGAMPGIVAGILPQGMAGAGGALALFVAGALAVCVLAYILGAIVLRPLSRRATPAK